MDNIIEILTAEADDENSVNRNTSDSDVIIQNEKRPLLSSLRRRNLKNDTYKEGALNFLSAKYEVNVFDFISVRVFIKVFPTLFNIIRLLEQCLLSFFSVLPV